MGFSARYHTLCYGFLLMVGLIDLVGAILLQATVITVSFGVIYVAVGAFQLPRRRREDSFLPAMQSSE